MISWVLFITISRVKKLIDIEALGLSRLSVIVLDIHTDMKGYSLLTLPQVRYHYEFSDSWFIMILFLLFELFYTDLVKYFRNEFE